MPVQRKQSKQRKQFVRTYNPLMVLFAVPALLAAGCGPKSSDRPGSAPGGQAGRPIGDTLRLTIVPYEAADKLTDEYTPMAKYLARKMGKKGGVFFPVTDYAGVLPALQSGQVDVAYLSPLPYAIGTSQMKLLPLAMPWVKGTLTYHGIIFTRADSPIKSLADLKGRTFAFGDPGSTSGYLLPRRLLETNGVPLSSLKHYYNAGDADVVVKAVENGAADAGSAYASVFEVAYKGHPEKAKLMRVIAQTEELPNGIYVARGDMLEDEAARLRQAFLDMNTDPDGRVAMLKAPNDKIVPADDRLFDGVRQTAKAAGIDIKVLAKKK